MKVRQREILSQLVDEIMSWQSGFQLRVVSGPDEGRVYFLNYTKMTVGRARSEGAEAEGWVLLFDKSVSRQHGELLWSLESKSYQYKHLSQTNLSWLNSEPIEESVYLAPGSELKFGNSSLILEALDSSLVAEEAEAEASPLAASNELTAKIDLAAAPSPIALKQGDSFVLDVCSGPASGLSAALVGFYVTVGRHNQDARTLTGDADAQAFDQMIEVDDPSLMPNHLILKWNELENGFSVWKNPAADPVTVKRSVDGLDWEAKLRAQGAVLRSEDSVWIEGTQLSLMTESSKESQSVGAVPLRR